MIIGEEMYAWEFASFLFGVVFTLWVQHARSYAKAYVRGFRVPDREERRARNLHMEMEKLKRMGYVE